MSKILSDTGVRKPVPPDASPERSHQTEQPQVDSQERHSSILRRVSATLASVETSTRQQYVLLAAITLLAAALRFYRLGDWSFWIDEIYTINHAQRHFGTLDLLVQNIPPARNWVPTSVILAAQSMNLFGVSEWSARLVPAAIGTLSIPILYFPVRKLLGTPVALTAVLLLAVSPWHINWSQNARGYTMLMLLYTLALFAFYQAIERDRPRYFIAFFVLLYLAASERLIALFIVPILALYLLFLYVSRWPRPPGLRVRNLVLLLSPGLVLLASQLLSFLLASEFVLIDIAGVFEEIVSTFYGNSIENPLTQAVFVTYEIGVPLAVFALFSGLYWLTTRRRIALFTFLVAVVPFALVVAMTPFMFTEERYVLVALPGFIILAAVGLRKLFSRAKSMEKIVALGIIALLISDASGANLLYFHTNNGDRRDWRGAFALVEANMQEEDIVVSTWPELGNYYLERDVLLWQDVDVDAIQRTQRNMWFVVIPDMAWVTGTQDLYWWVAHNSYLMDVRYLRTVDDANLEIYLYDPGNPAGRYFKN